MTRYDAIVIGGGINGLTCATALAKSGLRTVLLEQRDTVGGCAAQSTLAGDFRVPTLAHATGPVRRDVVEELQLYLARAHVRRSGRSTCARCLRTDARW